MNSRKQKKGNKMTHNPTYNTNNISILKTHNYVACSLQGLFCSFSNLWGLEEGLVVKCLIHIFFLGYFPDSRISLHYQFLCGSCSGISIHPFTYSEVWLPQYYYIFFSIGSMRPLCLLSSFILHKGITPDFLKICDLFILGWEKF